MWGDNGALAVSCPPPPHPTPAHARLPGFCWERPSSRTHLGQGLCLETGWASGSHSGFLWGCGSPIFGAMAYVEGLRLKEDPAVSPAKPFPCSVRPAATSLFLPRRQAPPTVPHNSAHPGTPSSAVSCAGSLAGPVAPRYGERPGAGPTQPTGAAAIIWQGGGGLARVGGWGGDGGGGRPAPQTRDGHAKAPEPVLTHTGPPVPTPGPRPAILPAPGPARDYLSTQLLGHLPLVGMSLLSRRL